MNYWLMAYYAISLIGVGIAIEEHGKEKKGKHNFWISLIAFALIQFLLIKAGILTLF
jgi:hypothetical protein